MVHDPEVEVGLGAAREVLQKPRLPDGLDRGAVQPLVPVLDRLRPGDLPPLFQALKVPAGGDVVQKQVVAAQGGEADFGRVFPGGCAVTRFWGGKGLQPRGLREAGVLRLQDQVFEGIPQLHGNLHLEDHHLGVDKLLACGLGQGHPVVPVLDEKALPHLVDLDGGKVHPLELKRAEAFPTIQGMGGFGQEAVVEVLIPVHRARDPVHGNAPNPQVVLPAGMEGQGLVKGQEVVGFPLQAVKELMELDAQLDPLPLGLRLLGGAKGLERSLVHPLQPTAPGAVKPNPGPVPGLPPAARPARGGQGVSRAFYSPSPPNRPFFPFRAKACPATSR